MLGFEDSMVNKINTVPILQELGNRQQTSRYININTLESYSSGVNVNIHESSAEVVKADGGIGEKRPYLVEMALETIVLGVSDQSATLVFSSLF